MLDEKLLSEKVQALLLDICAVLHSYGYREVSVGVLMRMVGVPDERARDHDSEIFEITKEVRRHEVAFRPPSAPPGVTLH
jgi:hypothetical protein